MEHVFVVLVQEPGAHLGVSTFVFPTQEAAVAGAQQHMLEASTVRLGLTVEVWQQVMGEVSEGVQVQF